MRLFINKVLLLITLIVFIHDSSCAFSAISSDQDNSLNAIADLYLVEHNTVDITSTSSQNARNVAILTAQRNAFKIMLERLIPPSEQAKFLNISDENIEYMVQDFEIIKEKITKTRYVATFSVRFNPTAVEKVLNNNNSIIQPQIQVCPEILIIPIMQKNAQAMLWEENNLWLDHWVQNSLPQGNYKVVLPVGDLADINELTVDDALFGEKSKIAKMLSRYGLQQTIIINLKIDSSGSLIELRKFIKDGLVAHLTQTVSNDLNMDDKKLFQDAFQVAQQLIITSNKDNYTIQNAKRIEVVIDYKGFEEWLNINSVFKNAPGMVHHFKINKIARHSATVTFDLNQPLDYLQTYLLSNGYTLKEISPNKFQMSFDSSIIKNTQKTLNIYPITDTVDTYSRKDDYTLKVQSKSPYYMPTDTVALPSADNLDSYKGSDLTSSPNNR